MADIEDGGGHNGINLSLRRKRIFFPFEGTTVISFANPHQRGPLNQPKGKKRSHKRNKKKSDCYEAKNQKTKKSVYIFLSLQTLPVIVFLKVKVPIVIPLKLLLFYMCFLKKNSSRAVFLNLKFSILLNCCIIIKNTYDSVFLSFNHSVVVVVVDVFVVVMIMPRKMIFCC